MIATSTQKKETSDRFGIKGFSPCYDLRFDFVGGFTVESLHCVYLEVNKLLMKAMFNSFYQNQKFYIGEPKKLQIVNKKKLIKIFSTILCKPRPFSEIADWKRSEL